MAILVVLGAIYLEDSESTQPWRIQVQLIVGNQKAQEEEEQHENALHPGNFARVAKFRNPCEIL